MRLRLAVVGAAFVVTTACVPPPPKDLSNNFVVSYAGPAPSDFMAVRAVQGTVTNTGVTPADYSVEGWRPRARPRPTTPWTSWRDNRYLVHRF